MIKKIPYNGVLGFTTGNGDFQIETLGTVCNEHTIYDCASLTKSVVTTTLFSMLLENKKIHLEDLVSHFLPGAVWGDDVTVRDLLSYSVDFGIRLSLLKSESAAGIRNKIMSAKEVTRIDEGQNFINATSMVLGWIIEEITHQPLDILAEECIFEPRKMNTTWMAVSGNHRSETLRAQDSTTIAPSEIDPWRGGEVRGQVHDESAWVFARRGKAVGSAGLFSTVPDLLVFADWVLQAKQMQPNSLGWEKNASWMPTFEGKDVFGKSGFTGCGLVFIPSENKAAVILTNATYPARPKDRTDFNSFRKEMLTKALEARLEG